MGTLNGRRVLVVDDEFLVRFVVADDLHHTGAEVVEAGDGQAALDLIDGGLTLDALVTDVRMPRMDGWTLAEAARTRRPDLPVLYVTGYSDVAARPVAGARVIHKPFPNGAVSAAVDAMLRTS